MSQDHLAYWLAIIIPCVLLLLGSFTQKLIENVPFNRKHFYVGLDLTIYFLATCFVNVADLTKEPTKLVHDDRFLLTTALAFMGFIVLVVQTAVHQEWEKDEKFGRKQFLWLCFASNAAGLVLLGVFVWAKTKGHI